VTATDLPRPELTGVGGVPECLLSPTLLASLPENTSEAPWTVNCSAVLWTTRPTAAAREALPPALRDHRAAVVVGGMVRYLETPVGPYDEVFGIVMLREGLRRSFGHVAFMAVDSPASLVGGRTNWAMPKTLASFGGGVGHRRTIVARGQDTTWEVSAKPHVVAPRLPVRSSAVTRQQFPGERLGDSRLSARAKARPALVEVDVSSEGPLADWLRPGRHLGAIAETVTFTLGRPELR
jgi:hypothetical protein